MFVGDGAAKPGLVELVRARGLNNVICVDPRPKDQMPAFWSVCGVALIHLKNDPVFAEVIPSKIFEAMAMGLPLLLVAPTGEASEIIEREGAGIAVAAGQPKQLADAILRLADDPKACARFASSSLLAAPNYSRELQAKRMERVLQRVVDNDRRSRAK
jgi:glycosyltransferase involved in cell wall biosynthesis